jgi:hypothetical protein
MTIVLLIVCLILLCWCVGFDVYRHIIKPYGLDDVDDDRLFNAMLLLDLDSAFAVLDASALEFIDVDELHHAARAVLMHIVERERFVPATYPEAVATELIHRILIDLVINGEPSSAQLS